MAFFTSTLTCDLYRFLKPPKRGDFETEVEYWKARRAKKILGDQIVEIVSRYSVDRSKEPGSAVVAEEVLVENE
jgi:hypothetical protein